jgi:hypothetical protein
MQAKIAKRVVDGVQPPDVTYLVRNTEIKGFGLVVTSAGTRRHA